MLRLFRNIRQKLLIEKKFGKYLLYAIGEIIILIMGILFALQVNNWNEKRLDRKSEISILKSMKTELESDLENLISDIKVQSFGTSASQIILDHLNNNLPYNDSLAIHFLDTSIRTNFMYSDGAYKTFQSLGISLISNEKLKNKIINLYAQYEVIIRIERSMADDMSHAANNIFNSRFDELYNYKPDLPVENQYGEMIPLDYEGLKIDQEYKYHLKTYNNTMRMNQEWFYNPTKNMISQLILSIEEEIEELEK